MNICILYYDDFYEAEVVYALGNLKDQNIFAAALEDRVYISSEKQRYLPDRLVNTLNPDDIDLFIIPGGNTVHLFQSKEITSLITALNERQKYIAGICGGTFLMASCGILDGKRCTGGGSGLKAGADYMELFRNACPVDEDVVTDGNTITSTAQAAIEFAVEIGRVMKVYKDENEMQNDYKWLKNIKEHAQ